MGRYKQGLLENEYVPERTAWLFACFQSGKIWNRWDTGVKDFQLDVEFEIIATFVDDFGLIVEQERGVFLGVVSIDGAD